MVLVLSSNLLCQGQAVGINTPRMLDVFDGTNPQLRLSQTDGTVYTDFQSTSAGYLYINPSEARVGIGTASPERVFHISAPGNNLLMLQSTTGGNGNTVNIDFMTYGVSPIYPTGRISAIDEYYSSHIAFLTKIPGADANGLVERMRLTHDGNFGIGTSTPSLKLQVEASGATVAGFNRTTSNGTVISIQKDGTEEGTISITNSTVSYNAFTGSHYSWTDQQIEKGMLVTLTGRNQYFHHNKESEIIYGVQKSVQPNDPKIMGAFLGLQESTLPFSIDNPKLVMAVGNGVIWVADKGEDLEIGDYLISSDVPGHAMKDDGTYSTSFVIARVAEPIHWAAEKETINGVKHKLVSVFFESFVRNNAEKELEKTKLELEKLIERVEALEKLLMHSNSALTTEK